MWRAVKLQEFLEVCRGVGNIRLMGFKFVSPIQKYVLNFARAEVKRPFFIFSDK